MQLTKLILTFSALALSAGLLQADLTRTEVATKGGWIVHSVADENGDVVRSEMLRTYDTKQEMHLRISFDGQNFHLDSSSDWSQIPNAKSHAAEYRIDSAANESAWKGKAKVIEEADGMTWLRITEPNEPGVGDGISNAKKLLIYVGEVGESVEWTFDLKGSNAAYKAMVDSFMNAGAKPKGTTERAGAGKTGAVGQLIEHEYARPGDWAVHYYTDQKGRYVKTSMIRFYEGNGKVIRVTSEKTQMHVDAMGDWSKLDGIPLNNEGKIEVTLASDESPGDNSLKYDGTIINDEGDKWLRLTQSFDEPGGLADGYRNSSSLRLKFSKTKYWSFDLKGSHAADTKMYECMEKYQK